MPAAKFMLVGTVLALVAEATAAPIRVGILKGTGPNRYWHTSMHPGSEAIAAMLANPAGSNLQNPVIPPQGFSVSIYGPMDSTQCSGTGCGPSSAQIEDFINALDTLDAVVVMNLVEIGAVISSSSHRDKLSAYMRIKGAVSLHQSNDQFGGWTDWLIMGVTRFRGHPPTHMQATIRIDNVGTTGLDPDWKFLNHGLSDSARFYEEWLTFQHNGAAIRADSGYGIGAGLPPVRVTTHLDEATYAEPVEARWTMEGDHPMSWYRKFPEGGRFFYTALGHRTETYDSVHFFRRQLYNAILWAGGYDVATAIQARGGISGGSRGDFARMQFSGGTLTVSLLHNGAHTIEILGLDGRRVDLRRGAASGESTFENLRSGVHIVAVTTPAGRYTGKVLVP